MSFLRAVTLDLLSLPEKIYIVVNGLNDVEGIIESTNLSDINWQSFRSRNPQNHVVAFERSITKCVLFVVKPHSALPN